MLVRDMCHFRKACTRLRYRRRVYTARCVKHVILFVQHIQGIYVIAALVTELQCFTNRLKRKDNMFSGYPDIDNLGICSPLYCFLIKLYVFM